MADNRRPALPFVAVPKLGHLPCCAPPGLPLFCFLATIATQYICFAWYVNFECSNLITLTKVNI